MAKYTFVGYDKDGDIYEDQLTADSSVMPKIAEIITRHQLKTDELRCKTTNEPFDWFLVQNENGRNIMLFSSSNPAGELIPKFEQLKQAIIGAGTAAIEDFVNQPVNPGISQKNLDELMNETWMQMPWEDLRKFYEKYHIDLI